MRWWRSDRAGGVDDVIEKVTSQAATVRDQSEALRERTVELERAANRLTSLNTNELRSGWTHDDYVDPR
jgi:hypothetical protein